MLLLFSLHLRRLVIIAEYRTKSEPTRQERLGDKLLPLTRPNEAHQSHGNDPLSSSVVLSNQTPRRMRRHLMRTTVKPNHRSNQS